MSEVVDASFEEFVVRVEPMLRRGLVARYGNERGREAAAEALAYAWEHWTTVSAMRNPTGFLYRVGQSRTRRRRHRVVFERQFSEDPLVEPALPRALERLSPRQRVAVTLVYGFGMTLREVAELTGLRITTVQTHADRGLERLRKLLGSFHD